MTNAKKKVITHAKSLRHDHSKGTLNQTFNDLKRDILEYINFLVISINKISDLELSQRIKARKAGLVLNDNRATVDLKILNLYIGALDILEQRIKAIEFAPTNDFIIERQQAGRELLGHLDTAIQYSSKVVEHYAQNDPKAAKRFSVKNESFISKIIAKFNTFLNLLKKKLGATEDHKIDLVADLPKKGSKIKAKFDKQ